MLAPQSIRFYFDQSDIFRCQAEESTQVDAYMRAMRVVQQRAGDGMTPRAALANCAPVHAQSLEGPVTLVRVSGIPHKHNPVHDPVMLSDTEHTLFLKRGDHYMARVEQDGVMHSAYVALDYSIAPRMITSDRPIVLHNPAQAMMLDADAARLLEILQERELTAAEQFVAAQTLPTIWRRYGGPPVAAIAQPNVQDVAESVEFVKHFSNAYQRLRSLTQLSHAWNRAILGPDAANQEAIAPADDREAVPSIPQVATAQQQAESRPRGMRI